MLKVFACFRTRTGENNATEAIRRNCLDGLKVVKKRSGKPRKSEDEALEVLLDGDRCQTLKQLSDTFNVTEIGLGLVQKAGIGNHMN